MRLPALLLALALLLTAQAAQARSDRQILTDWFRQRGHHLERLQVAGDWALGTASWKEDRGRHGAVPQVRAGLGDGGVRHGRIFQDPMLRADFGKRRWYRPDPSYTDARLTRVERANADRMAAWQKAHPPQFLR